MGNPINKNMDTSNKVNESLRDWFGKSKSKDGKPGWVQADGSPCANEKGETKTPKCFSSSRLASLKRQGKKGKAKIAAAVRRKREQDPGQQQKSGAAKPTMVRTFAKKKDYKSHPSGDQSGTKSESYSSPMVKRVIERAEVLKILKSLEENNDPTNPKLWNKAKELAEGRFDFYSHDAHDWACKWYIQKGGNWITEERRREEPEDREICPHCSCEPCECEDSIYEAARIPTQYGNVYDLTFNWRGKMYAIKMFFPKVSKPQKAEVQNALSKIYPGSVLKRFSVTAFDNSDSYIHVGTDDMKESVQMSPQELMIAKKMSRLNIQLAKKRKQTLDKTDVEDTDETKTTNEDWQKVNRRDKTDGLSQKAVNAYRRENPGSKLKTAVTTKPSKLKKGSKSAKRRLSFCRRMKGMKKRLTSAKTARDPDSRINKALRRWNC